MRHLRLRLRSTVIFILALLTIFFLITLYTLIWAASELEQRQQVQDVPIPPDVIPFWSAFAHQNIYDLYATPANTIFILLPNITQRRIEELFQLIHTAKLHDSRLVDKKKLFPIDSKWNFQKLVAEREAYDYDDHNQRNPNTTDSADNGKNKTVTMTIRSNRPMTNKSLSEHDKRQLRNYVYQMLTKWKEEHQNDKISSIADLMHRGLVQDDPS